MDYNFYVEKIGVLEIKRVKITLQIYPLEEIFLWCLEHQNARNLGPWPTGMHKIDSLSVGPLHCPRVQPCFNELKH